MREEHKDSRTDEPIAFTVAERTLSEAGIGFTVIEERPPALVETPLAA